jgi:putative inorganic carbon (HCO3(-)) transporter
MRADGLQAAPVRALPREWIILPLVGLALLLGSGSVASPPLVLIGVLGLVFVAVAMRSLAAGVVLFTLLVFLERIPNLSSSVTFVKLAGGVLAVSWFVRVMRRDGRSPILFRDHPALAYAALLFLGWTFASAHWAEDPDRAASSAFQVLQGVLLLAIVFTAISDRRHFRWIIWAFIAGAVLSAVIGLAGVTRPEEFGPDATRRLSGGIGDPNELASVAVPALVLALFSQASSQAPLARWMLLCSAVILAITLFRTESRGGLVASGVTLVAAILLSGPVRARVLTGGLIVAGAGVAYYSLIAPPEALRRITEFGSGSGRTDLWTLALEAFRHNPVTGVGAGNFTVVEPTLSVGDVSLGRAEFASEQWVVHNTYLHVMAELGIIGLLLFAAILLAALTIAWRAVRSFVGQGDRETEILARGLMIGTIGMLAAFVFLSAQYEKQLPLLLGTLTALSTLAGTRQAAAPRPAPRSMPVSAPAVVRSLPRRRQ